MNTTSSPKNKPYAYQGEELELFSNACVWKRYISSHISRFVTGQVLEVGAGTGETTRYLCTGNITGWTCLEPDGTLAEKITTKINDAQVPGFCVVRQGTIASINEDELFDTILYIDVLEHIENDRAELVSACKHLKNNGHVIILSPAHQNLFSRFDAAVGHFRRYSSQQLVSLVPETVSCQSLKYLDSIGLFASLANKLALKSKYPTENQILFWDRVMVRISKVVDRLLFYQVGKSIVGIWKKTR